MTDETRAVLDGVRVLYIDTPRLERLSSPEIGKSFTVVLPKQHLAAS